MQPATNKVPFIRGRGSNINPENRFETVAIEPDPEAFAQDEEPILRTEYYVDNTREILAKNDSLDLPFDYSINPYRGCEHGCIYCYARPTHEYFGFSSGLDFETKILVKQKAADLLAQKFQSQGWAPQLIAFSGNTDCYQPIEKQLQLTRKCLAVFLDFRNPTGIITKNALILRDLDILEELARLQLVSVAISVTTLNNALAGKMEPRASSPMKRLDTLEKLAAAGIPTRVMIAPVIPGLTDHEIPAILRECAGRGVKHAAYILLRLPHSVKELVQNWLRTHYPDRENKVLNSVKETRAGKLNDPRFGSRMSGTGVRAEMIKKMFELSCKKYGMNEDTIELTTKLFRRGSRKQLQLF